MPSTSLPRWRWDAGPLGHGCCLRRQVQGRKADATPAMLSPGLWPRLAPGERRADASRSRGGTGAARAERFLGVGRGPTQLHRASDRPPGASVSPPDTGTLTSPFGVCPGCRLWLSTNHLQGHTLFHFSRHLRHGPHCPHLQTESWSAERRPCAAGTPPSEPKSP